MALPMMGCPKVSADGRGMMLYKHCSKQLWDPQHSSILWDQKLLSVPKAAAGEVVWDWQLDRGTLSVPTTSRYLAILSNKLWGAPWILSSWQKEGEIHYHLRAPSSTASFAPTLCCPSQQAGRSGNGSCQAAGQACFSPGCFLGMPPARPKWFTLLYVQAANLSWPEAWFRQYLNLNRVCEGRWGWESAPRTRTLPLSLQEPCRSIAKWAFFNPSHPPSQII